MPSKLKEYITGVCSSFVENTAQMGEILTGNPLPDEKKEKMKKMMLKEMGAYRDRLKRAFIVLAEEKLITKEQLEDFPERFKRKFSDDMLDGEDIEEVEFMGLGQEKLMEIYKYGVELLEAKSYEKSAALFCLLTTLLPNQKDFWLASGFAYEGNKEFVHAFAAFNQSVVLYPDNLDPVLNAANCLIKAKKKRDCMEYLREVYQGIKFAGAEEKYKNVMKAMKEIKMTLKASKKAQKS